MAERLPNHKPAAERLRGRHELLQASAERHRSTEKSSERMDATKAELQRHSQAEKARETIAKTEIKPAAGHEVTPDQSEHQPHHPLSGVGRRLNYQHTLASVQRHLPAASRSFSKVIHNPTVERVSEAAGKTVARPSVTAGATTTALLAGGFLYLFARHYGYEISYLYIPAFLVAGGIIGAVLEGLAKLFRRKH